MLTFIDGDALAVRGSLWLQFPASFIAVDSAEDAAKAISAVKKLR